MTPTVPSPGRPPPVLPGRSPSYRRRRVDVVTALTAGAVTSLCAWAAAAGTVGSLERRVFAAVNGLPDLLRVPLWLVQTVGVLGTPLVVAAAALVLRYRRLAVAAALLVPAKLGVERELLKVLVPRERPGTTIPGAVLRDVPSAGPSFPSGHAVIAVGLVVLLAPYLHRRWLLAVVALAVLNSVARVYLGAHAPLDVAGGACAGLAVGALLNLLVGVPAATRGRASPPG